MRFRVEAMLAALLLASCTSPGRPAIVGGPAREQPAALVGFWRMEPAGDSGTILVLRPDALQWSQRAGRARGEPVAWWWVERRDRGSERLCLHWRPGRHAADCAPFSLDTLVTDSTRAVRLTWGHRRFVAISPLQ